MSLFEHTLAEIQELLRKKEVTVSDLVEESFKRIQEVDDKVQAFISLEEERARQKAKELDDQLANGEADRPLFGMPIAIKDNIVTQDLRTTCASKMLENFLPIYNATVMDKLEKAGAITVGKTNMDEFAMGGTTETSYFQKTRNPWNLDHVPGGSSGGSAAAVAAGEVPFALGSDTGGSVRQPAAYCGVVGMKPTYGRVSRYGLVAFASSLDQIGTITRNVADSAQLLQVIAGLDEKDSTSANVPVPDYMKELNGDIKGMKIAVPKEFLSEGISEEVRRSVEAALAKFTELGATWEEVSLPHVKYSVPVYYIVSSAEAFSNLARFDGIRYGYRPEDVKGLEDLYKKSRSEGFGTEVKRRILLGAFVLSSENYDTYFKKAQQVRTLIRQDFDKIFADYDVIVGPTTPTAAPELGKLVDDPLTMYMRDILTIPVNLAGLPAISIPCGFANGLPLGLQIIGKQFAESTVFRTAHAFEQVTDFHKQRPQL